MNTAYPAPSRVRLIDRWFMAPEPNAAGRLGLFRILYAAFYLWHLSFQRLGSMHGLPEDYYHRVLPVLWCPLKAVPLWVLPVVEAALVAALVLLLVGYRTRLATLAVLGLGGLSEAWFTSVDIQRANTLVAFWIPAFMVLADRWGDTYSLDAHLLRRRGGITVDPADPGWPWFLPARGMLVLMSVLFLLSAMYKVAMGGTWIQRPDLLANIMLDRRIVAAMAELPVNPIAPFLAERPWLYIPLQAFVVLFEACFVLALFGRRIRNLILSTALIFHAVNGLWLVITFTSILIPYALFVDLQRARDRFLPGRLLSIDRLPAGLLVAGALAAAISAAFFWNAGGLLRSAAGFGGLIDWRTIWYFILPLAIVWWLRSVLEIGRALWGPRAQIPDSAVALVGSSRSLH